MQNTSLKPPRSNFPPLIDPFQRSPATLAVIYKRRPSVCSGSGSVYSGCFSYLRFIVDFRIDKLCRRTES